MNQSITRILNFESGKIKVKIYLLLGFICTIGYWPVSLNLFTLKNDATRYFLPYRYNISNIIQNGEFPFWSYYIYGGLPIHADMQSGVWNPVVWIISLFTRYNMSVLHFESLLYIFIGGIGMYKLLAEFGIMGKAKLIIAISYMYCGFVTDSAQFIVWLSCAAFVPFVFLYYYRLLYRSEPLNALKAALALFMLLVAGYPSLFIYCCYVLLAALIFRLSGFVQKKCLKEVKPILLTQILFSFIFLVVSLPAIVSYVEFLPYYSRGAAITLTDAFFNPFCLKCNISFLIPFDLSREDIGFGTDPTMRNGYIGIFSILFFVIILGRKMNALQKFILMTILLSFLFSLGDATPVREFFYRHLPLMDYFKHSSNMRLFTSIGILVMAAFGMEVFLTHQKDIFLQKKVLRISLVMAAAIVILIIIFSTHPLSVLQNEINFHSTSTGFRNRLKDFLYNISFSSTILAVGIIQLLFLLLFNWLGRNKTEKHTLPLLIIANAVFIGQLTLPFTVVSRLAPQNINNFIAQYPSGFPIPDLETSVGQNTAEEYRFDPLLLGNVSFYNKKISVQGDIMSPCIFSNFGSFLKNKKIYDIVGKYPVIYLSDSTVQYKDTAYFKESDTKKYVFVDSAHVKNTAEESNISSLQISSFKANSFNLKTRVEDSTYLNIFQNNYKHWRAKVDGKPVAIISSNISFMSVIVPPGMHTVQFIYYPVSVCIAMAISGVAITLLIVFYIQHLKVIQRAPHEK